MNTPELGRDDAPDHAPAGRGLTGLTLIASLLAAALLLAGCATPGTLPPAPAALTPADLGARAVAVDWPQRDWWATWGDPELAALVARALDGQPALQAVQARLRQAEAAVAMADAARGPQLTGSVALTDQRYSENGLVPAPLAGSVQWSNDAQLGASWELDLFGRQRAALDAAIGQWRAGQADAQAARQLLASNIALGWVQLGRLIDTRGVAQRALAQREQVLALVRQRIGAGLDTTVELRQAEGTIAQSKVELEALDEAIARARHALAELSGQRPDALDAAAPTLAALTPAPRLDGLPVDLVGRRADLVAQRWRVEAALRGVDVAKAQFHPNVDLKAFVGLSSLGLDRFVRAGSLTYGAGPALHLPIFDGGRLRAQLQSSQAEVDAAIDGYNASLLRALREVADEIGSLQSLQRQQVAQSEALAAAESAFDLSVQRYRAGLGNFLIVLTAEANVLAQRRAGTDLSARQLAAELALIKALGGGYDDTDTTLAAQAPR